MRRQVAVDQLAYAASVSQQTSGNTAASKIIKAITASPTQAKRFRKANQQKRFAIQEVLDQCTQEEMEYMELITKWGCDDSQQSQFQQTFFDISSDDSNIFQSSLVPLRLQVNIRSHKKILWQNPTPSSTRFCRPIRIRFLHEIVDITKEEIKYVEDQAKDLRETKTELFTSGYLRPYYTFHINYLWKSGKSDHFKIVKETKEKIQKEFKDRTRLIVDMPKAGFGNSNSGNTSTRFFSDPKTAAKITGIDLTLIQKLKIILEALSSGHKIDEIKFTEFAKETARLYTNLYGWHQGCPK
ncbi:hypothetical protein ILUMI_25380 [Ignelater luminosus]|uniref:Uncharacterized protein n=1 Tax=Ignelater luminosus TaxID=2038154 RepID=A0A8K0CAN1_IGNLU|nr:hypothetical protein ILUMI_25380 [Ignelater luminosus]